MFSYNYLNERFLARVFFLLSKYTQNDVKNFLWVQPTKRKNRPTLRSYDSSYSIKQSTLANCYYFYCFRHDSFTLTAFPKNTFSCRELFNHNNTCFMQKGHRRLQMYPPLKSCFASQKPPPIFLQKFEEHYLCECFLRFVHSLMSVFHDNVNKLEKITTA